MYEFSLDPSYRDIVIYLVMKKRAKSWNIILNSDFI